MHDPFRSRDHIRRVDEPVLIVHGVGDRIIPVDHGRKLFAAAAEPKALQVLEEANHHDLWDRGLWPTALEFLAENGVTAQPAP